MTEVDKVNGLPDEIVPCLSDEATPSAPSEIAPSSSNEAMPNLPDRLASSLSDEAASNLQDEAMPISSDEAALSLSEEALSGFANDAAGSLSDGSAALADEPDGELRLLFSAFDDVCASDEMKEQTLNCLFDSHKFSEAPARATEETACSKVSTTESAESDSLVEEAAASAKEEEILTAVLGGVPAAQDGEEKSRRMRASGRRTRFRAFRVAAVAACLVLALVGGVAYAVPTSTVQLSQGDAAVELGVNRFGFVVFATSNDDSGRAIVEKGGLLTSSYDDALEHIAGAFGEPSSDRPFEAVVNSHDEAQRGHIEERNREFMAERNGAWSPDSASGAGGPQENSSGWRPETQQAPTGSPAGAPTGALDSTPGQAGQPGGAWNDGQRGEGDATDRPSEQVGGESGEGWSSANQPGEEVDDGQRNDGETNGGQPELDRSMNVQSYGGQQDNEGQVDGEQLEVSQQGAVQQTEADQQREGQNSGELNGEGLDEVSRPKETQPAGDQAERGAVQPKGASK